ncbi:MFS transporter [Sphingobacterium spiritivorum]|nr:MFS transporter [Sphingobacterium spiritivorum]
MMLCGYLAEKVGWHWGFGLAGIFMFLGTIQFWAAKPLMGNLGVLDKSAKEDAEKKLKESEEESKRNPYTTFDMVLIGFITVVGFMYAFNDPLSKNGVVDIFKFIDTSYLRGQYLMIFIALIAFIYLIVSRILRYGKIVRDRMFAVILLAFFLIFFFMSFEQGATSLVLVARDHIDRQLSGNSLMIFNIVNALFTIVPLTIISWVLILLAKATWKKNSSF